ncbi:MAG: hypothetical protein ABIA78_02610 [archaeon]
MNFLKKIFGKKKKFKSQEDKNRDYYLKKAGMKEEPVKTSNMQEALEQANKFERERRKQAKENREAIGKTKLKGKVIYNFSEEKSEKFTLKFELTEKGVIQTQAVDVKNIAGLANLSGEQKSKIYEEINKFISKNPKPKNPKEKNEIKITFEGKLK